MDRYEHAMQTIINAFEEQGYETERDGVVIWVIDGDTDMGIKIEVHYMT